MLENITIVIRAAHERTEKLCKKLVEAQVLKDNIFFIHEKPFAKAVERTFKIGIKQENKWTLAIDADVLTRRGTIVRLVANAEGLESEILERLYVYQGNILCKVYGKIRRGGFHLYQTKYLNKGLKYLEQTKSNIRPESATYKKMRAEGFIHFRDDQVHGLHGYEQYYRDMFRNGFFQAKKISYIKRSKFITLWKNKAVTDLDYKVLLQGLMYGITHTGEIKVDYDFLKKIIDEEFPKIGIKEKEAIGHLSCNYLFHFIESEIKKQKGLLDFSKGIVL